MITALILVASLANASTTDKVSLEGFVVRFDSKTVVVESGNTNFEVPRAKAAAKLRVGERVGIAMTEAELSALKKSPVK